MKLLKHIPNLFTLINLLCGSVAIIFVFNAHLAWASYLVGVALVFDFLDGFLARILKATSEIGKQLDSLADLISFGVVPGMMMFQYISIGFREYFTDLPDRDVNHLLLSSVGLLVIVFSALRLAKFNVDERQTNNFIGLPTPANAMLIASLPLIIELQFNLNPYYPVILDTKDYLLQSHYLSASDMLVANTLFNPYFHVVLAVVLSLLLLMPLNFFSLKFKNFGWKDNSFRYIFILVVLLSLGYAIYSLNFFMLSRLFFGSIKMLG